MAVLFSLTPVSTMPNSKSKRQRGRRRKNVPSMALLLRQAPRLLLIFAMVLLVSVTTFVSPSSLSYPRQQHQERDASPQLRTPSQSPPPFSASPSSISPGLPAPSVSPVVEENFPVTMVPLLPSDASPFPHSSAISSNSSSSALTHELPPTSPSVRQRYNGGIGGGSPSIVPLYVRISDESWRMYSLYRGQTCRDGNDEAYIAGRILHNMDNLYFSWEERAFHVALRSILLREPNTTMGYSSKATDGNRRLPIPGAGGGSTNNDGGGQLAVIDAYSELSSASTLDPRIFRSLPESLCRSVPRPLDQDELEKAEKDSFEDFLINKIFSPQ